MNRRARVARDTPTWRASVAVVQGRAGSSCSRVTAASMVSSLSTPSQRDAVLVKAALGADPPLVYADLLR